MTKVYIGGNCRNNLGEWPTQESEWPPCQGQLGGRV